MALFDRNYLIRVIDLDDQNNTIQLEIRPPFNVDFECRRKDTGGNSLDLTIYGLGEQARLILSKRRYEFAEALAIENGRLKSAPINGLKKQNTNRGGKELIIEFFVGYGDDLKRIFLGEIVEAKNTRTESGFETEILCIEDYSARQRAYTTRAITSRKEAIEKLMSDAGLEVGNIQLVRNDFIRPKIMSGRPLDILNNMADGQTEIFYTDTGKGYFEPVSDAVITGTNFSRFGIGSRIVPIPIDASNGLLNTPSRQGEFLTFQTMINPDMFIRCYLSVKSIVDPTINGEYQVFDLTYVGSYESSSYIVDVQARATSEQIRDEQRDGQFPIEP